MYTTQHLRLRRMMLCALFTALTAVCSQIALPMPWGIPVNLALFAVYLAGVRLGPVWGAVSQLVYLALAAVGAFGFCKLYFRRRALAAQKDLHR